MIVGMLISSFLLYEHFAPSASTFCNVGEGFDCGIVNKSPYANLDGISFLLTIDMGLNLPIVNLSEINWFFDLLTSNAFLGFLTLVFMFSLTIFHERKKDFWFIKNDKIYPLLFGLGIFGVFYGGYLFMVQKFLLKTYCIFCLGLDAVLITQLILIWKMKGKK